MYNVILLSDITDPIFLNKNVGPYTVANALRNQGIDATVIHHLNMWDLDDLISTVTHLVNEHTLFVGFNNFFYKIVDQTPTETGEVKYHRSDKNTLLPHGFEQGNLLAQAVKQKNPNCKIVLGGPKALATVSNKNVDYIFKGYSDTTVIEFADILIRKLPKPKSWIKNLFGITIIDGAGAESFDFVNTRMQWQPQDIILPGETLPIEIARGCIFRCKFCSYPLNGKKKLDYIKDIELLKQELIYNYEQFGITRYFFLDDTFNDSVEKLEMILQVSKSLPFQLEYWAYIRLDLLTAKPHTIDLLFDSGWRGAHFGLESMHAPTGEIIGKGGDPNKLIKTIAELKSRYGNDLLLHSSFIVGLPLESEEQMISTVERIESGEIAVDSSDFYTLWIQPEGYANYLSVFGTDFSKYGYKVKKEKDITDLEAQFMNETVVWESPHMDLNRALELEQSFMRRMWQVNNMRASMAFQIANLGFDFKEACATKLRDIRWHDLRLAKQSRFAKYQQLLWKSIDYVSDNEKQIMLDRNFKAPEFMRD